MAWEQRPERSATSSPRASARPTEAPVIAPARGWPELAVDVAAVASQLLEVRFEARRWMEAVDVPAELALDVLIALSEAATNAVLHAYPPGSPGRIRVLGRREGLEIELAVEDDGTWRERGAHHDGRGLAIIDAVSEISEVVRGVKGSRVAFRCAVPPSRTETGGRSSGGPSR